MCYPAFPPGRYLRELGQRDRDGEETETELKARSSTSRLVLAALAGRRCGHRNSQSPFAAKINRCCLHIAGWLVGRFDENQGHLGRVMMTLLDARVYLILLRSSIRSGVAQEIHRIRQFQVEAQLEQTCMSLLAVARPQATASSK